MKSFKGYVVTWTSKALNQVETSSFKTLAQARKFAKDAKKDERIKPGSKVTVYFESAGQKEDVTAWALGSK